MFQDVLLQTFWELHSCPELFAFYSVSQVLLAKAKPLPHCRLLGSKGWSHFLLAAWTSGILPNCYSPCSPSFSSYSDSLSPSSSTTPTLSSDYPDTEAFIFILLPACWTHLQTCLSSSSFVSTGAAPRVTSHSHSLLKSSHPLSLVLTRVTTAICLHHL